MNQEAYRKVISGESGCRCPCVGLGLSFAAMIYSLVIRLRNSLYSSGRLKAHRVNAKVLSVGNITVGGTGKTPLVVWMCDKITKNSKLKTQNCGVAILTRGYKATKNPKPKTQNYGDEPATLAESCPETKVIINPDRVAGAVEAITKFGVKVLVMDDGFQHRRLHRDLDIVTIDATLPFGYGRMLPAGLLREPVTSLNRADAVVITRCDQISQSQLIELEAKLQQFNLNMVIARSIHRPVCAKLADGKEISIEQLRDRKIFAFCGIGNPRAFLSTIKSTGAEVVGSKIYDDHHHYTPSDKSSIYEQAGNLKAELILTTQKDWTRIPASGPAPKDIPLAYLTIEIKFLAGEDKLINLIEKTLTGKILEK